LTLLLLSEPGLLGLKSGRLGLKAGLLGLEAGLLGLEASLLLLLRLLTKATTTSREPGRLGCHEGWVRAIIVLAVPPILLLLPVGLHLAGV
jgi:hypothetical protein